jgi:hypothetical protein
MDCVEANNLIEPQRREFAIRFYRWAEQDLKLEVDGGFGRVRSVKSSWAFHYVDFLSSLPRNEQLQAALAILRASIVHKMAREQLGLTLTPIEKQHVQDFQRRLHPIAWRSESEEKLLSSTRAEEFKLDKDELEELLFDKIGKALDVKPINSSLLFLQQIKGWYLETGADIRSVYQLRYGQYIIARKANDLCPVHLKEGGITILGWLGIHPDTAFNLLRKSELQEATTFVAEAIRYFASVAPTLLEGLEHKVPEQLDLSVGRGSTVKSAGIPKGRRQKR